MNAMLSNDSATASRIATGADLTDPDLDRLLQAETARTATKPARLDRGDRVGAAAAILLAGSVAATLDLMFAFTFYGVTLGVSPLRILHSIASGAFGMAAFDGGIATAAFGLVAHYFILIVAASLYYVASARVAALRRYAASCGLLFGVAIYCVMHYVVVPLSAAPKFRTSTLSITSEFLMHLVLGLTIAVVLRARAARAA